MRKISLPAEANGPVSEASFDLVCLFDAFHHLTRPEAILDAIRSGLRGPAVSGDPRVDAADPTAIITYGSNLLYCDSATSSRRRSQWSL